MYQVKRNGRTLKSIAPQPTYEKARQAVRKYMRKTIRGAQRFLVPGMWDGISRNPTDLTAAGFRIVRT